MAHLLLMFQKFRLLRERNLEQLNMTQANSKLTRIEKNIKNKQKYYTSLFTNLESQAKSMQNTMQMALRTNYGFDLNSNSLTNIGYSGMNNFIRREIAGLFVNGMPTGQKDADGNWIINKLEFNNNEDAAAFADNMCYSYVANKGKLVEGTEDGQFSSEQISFFEQARAMAMQAQEQAQRSMAEQSQIMQNNVSIWLEAQKEQLEAEQDSVIDALTYEQTMMELDKTYSEQRLQRINAEIEQYDQVISESVKDVPKFGLG